MLSRYLLYLRGNNKRNFSIFILLLLFALSSLACGSGGSNDVQATLVALEATNTAQENVLLKLTITAQSESASVPSGELDEFRTPTIQSNDSREEVSPTIQSDDNNTSTQPTQTNPTPPPLPPKDGLFFDDFSNNNNGWNLTADDNGSIGFAQKSLVISAKDFSCVIAPVPNFKTNDEYYIESDVKVTKTNFLVLGYVFGSEPLQFYKYGLGYYSSQKWGVFSFSKNNDVGHPLSEVSFGRDRLWESGQLFTLGIEVLSDSYTLYLNGDMLAATQFKPEGNSIGLFACSTFNRSEEVRFDNLVIRRSR